MSLPPETAPTRSFPRRLLNRLEVDRAVFFAIATRAWQFLSGPISILVIASCFTPELQGYYYAFANLMAIQSLVELGLHGVIINISSHEWAKLRLDSNGEVIGDDDAMRRMTALKNFVTRWYAIVAVLFFVGGGLGGALFLNETPFSITSPVPVLGAAIRVQDPAANIAWVAPWFCIVAINALLLWAWAYSAMLEGCNQVSVVNRIRLWQSLTGSLVVWSSMALGMGLWAAVATAGVRLVWDYWLIFGHYRGFWKSLSVDPGRDAISWQGEIWPLQWKMAVTGVATFFTLNLFVPVMLRAHGLVVCGQTGMTLGILAAIESAAFAWVYVRSSQFGMLAARKDWREMDRVFYRLTAISSCFFLLGIIAVCGGLLVLQQLPFELAKRLASRMLGLGPTMVFGCAYLLFHLPRCQSIYVRAHKQDPYLLAVIVTSALIATLVVLLGSWYGPLGAASGFLAIVATVNVPWWTVIWYRSRRDWHRDDSAGS